MNDKFEIINKGPIYDERGSFQRTYCSSLSRQLEGKSPVQTNVSINDKKYTLRGFHYEISMQKEWKLMSVVKGAIYLVVIDLRPSSKDYKKIIEINSSEADGNLFYVPSGYANAFLTLENDTIITYSMGSKYEECEYRSLFWKDKIFEEVKWPHEPLVISDNDSKIEHSFSL
jgi:dTDP-4-dehydrorhamnose 3,5-epimerase